MTHTLIQLVNRVLLDVGERQVTTISTPASRKAKFYIQDALNDIQMYHNWEWLHDLIGVNTFTNEKTTITNVRRVKRVFWDTGDTLSEIPWIPYSSFIQRKYIPFTATTNGSECPRYYTQKGDTQLLFNPYPTNDDGRNRIKVEVVKYILSPELESDIVQIPERFINILIKRAVYNMLIRHLGEPDMAQAMNFEFADILQRFRSQENRVPTSGTNMYAGRR